MTRIRVLRVIARMNVGGPALQVTALTEDLDQTAFESRLLVGSVDPGEADFVDLRAPDLPVRRVEGLGRSVRPGDDVRALRSIIAEIRDFRPHIVHTHTAKAGALGRVAAVTTRVPFRVHTFHGHLLHGYFSPPVTSAVALTERGLARVTHRLVAVGSRVRDELVAAKVGRPDQYVVVAPGLALPPRPDRADARDQLGLPADARIVAYVARLTQVKRPDRMADVARRVITREPNTVFAVVGEGDLLEQTRDAVRDLGESVRFLGWRSDVETVYAAADAVLLTSDNEGMPVTLIEAAMCGTPAVTTDVGSASEVVLHGETGFVVGREVGELADAVSALLRDEPERLRMGRAARNHAEEHFSRQRLVRDTEELYADLVGA